MKVLYVPARTKKILTEEEKLAFLKEARKLPRKIGLLGTAQTLTLLSPVSDLLRSLGKETFRGVCKATGKPGELLGCDASAALTIAKKVDCFLYVGTGTLHPAFAALETGLPVYAWQPGRAIAKISQETVGRLRSRQLAALKRVFLADKVGILVSTKAGQCDLGKALRIKAKLARKGKSGYIFVGDTLDMADRENFKLRAWISTACQALTREVTELLDSKVFTKKFK